MKHFLFSIVAITLLTACSEEPGSTETVYDLAAGKAIAEADCSACHGMDGRGATSEIPHLTAQPVQYLVEAMHAYRDGGRLHAALQDMTTGMSEADKPISPPTTPANHHSNTLSIMLPSTLLIQRVQMLPCYVKSAMAKKASAKPKVFLTWPGSNRLTLSLQPSNTRAEIAAMKTWEKC